MAAPPKRDIPTLTKRDLVIRISNDTGLRQRVVHDVIQRMLDAFAEALAKGDDIELRNFGVLETRLTRPRVGRNPKVPGSDIEIPARATIKFRAGKVLRQRVEKLVPLLKRRAQERRPAKGE
jgi:nucleoid DNA-binding protein